MKVAVSASGRDMDSSVDLRFGRCPCFLIVDTEDMSYKVVENESVALSGGAGIQAAQNVASEGADVVITGNCGPNALRTLKAASIKVVVGQSGSVRQAVEEYSKGKLESTLEANVSAHHGSQGYGMGWSAGRGQGCRRKGINGAVSKRRMAVEETRDNFSMAQPGQQSTNLHPEESEVNLLREQVKELYKQIRDIEARLSGVETDKE